MIATGYPLYSSLTNSQIKSADQIAIEVFFNNISLLLIQ